VSAPTPAALHPAVVHPAVLHPGALPAPLPTGPVPLTTATAPPQVVMTPTWFQLHAGWMTHTVAGLFVLCAIALVVLLAVQTTKQEGLSGTLGGRVESAYRGRIGAEEQLKRITGMAAVGFVVAAFILSLTGI